MALGASSLLGPFIRQQKQRMKFCVLCNEHSMTVVIKQCTASLRFDTGASKGASCQDCWVRRGVTLAQGGLEFMAVVLLPAGIAGIIGPSCLPSSLHFENRLCAVCQLPNIQPEKWKASKLK